MLVVIGGIELSLTGLVAFLPLLASNLIMNVWEEIGWRGYALPTLQRKYSALTSAVIVGAMWSLWHWPHFTVNNSPMMANYGNYLNFIALTIIDSIIHAWIYNSSKGSLIAATTYHASTNAANIAIFLENGLGSTVIPYYAVVLGIAALLITYVYKPRNLCREERYTI